MIDTHVHSIFSVDGKNTIEENIIAAIKNGLKIICFTEHFDMNKNDYGYLFYKEEAYFDEIKRQQDKYSDNLLILKGIEFSEPHIYRKELEEFHKKDYDFILGSIHWIGNNWIGDKKYTEKYSLENLYKLHYEETLNACISGGFDSLAHIDFPKMYLKEKYEPIELIRQIVTEIVKSNISIEINTSPLRKGFYEYYPSDVILNEYFRNGGKYYTVGSDSHIKTDIGADLEKIHINNLKPCYYKSRKRIAIEPNNCFNLTQTARAFAG